jgi:tRNA/tmRNA/rRNA uracil-C5-methylase (TrmA/RlmC/RlmD family)
VLVLVDPPATGLGAGVVSCLNALRPDFIAYVSCDAATQARDVRSLVGGGGYRLSAVRPLDMFPQTADIEVVAFLERPR